MADFTKIAITYDTDNSQFTHALDKDGTTLFVGNINNLYGDNGLSAARRGVIYKFATSDLSSPLDEYRCNYSGTNFQGIVHNSTYLFIAGFMGWPIPTGYVWKVARSNLTLVAHVGTWDGGATWQNLAIGNDANSVECVFPIGQRNAPSIGRYAASDLSCVSGEYWHRYGGGNAGMFLGLAKDGTDFYLSGYQQRDISGIKKCATITKVSIGTNDHFTAGAALNIYRDQTIPANFDFVFYRIIKDGNTLWAIGDIISPDSSGSYWDGLLAKIDATSGLSLSGLWRFHHSWIRGVRIFGISQDTNYLYLAVGHMPHGGMGGDEYAQTANCGYIIKVAKSAPNTIIWARGIMASSGAGHAGIWHTCPDDTEGVVYAGGGDDSVSSEVRGTIIRIDKDAGSLASPLYGADGKIKGYEAKTEFTVTSIHPNDDTDTHVDTGTSSFTPGGTDNTLSPSWNAWNLSTQEYEINDPNIRQIIHPTGDEIANIPSCTETYHYQAVDDPVGSEDEGTTRIWTQNTTWYDDLYSHGFTDTPEGDIEKVEIVIWSKLVGLSQSWAKPAWRFNAGDTQYGNTFQTTNVWGDHACDITAFKGSWSWADIQAMDFGLSARGSGLNGHSFTSVYLRITWKPWAEHDVSIALSQNFGIAHLGQANANAGIDLTASQGLVEGENINAEQAIQLLLAHALANQGTANTQGDITLPSSFGLTIEANAVSDAIISLAKNLAVSTTWSQALYDESISLAQKMGLSSSAVSAATSVLALAYKMALEQQGQVDADALLSLAIQNGISIAYVAGETVYASLSQSLGLDTSASADAIGGLTLAQSLGISILASALAQAGLGLSLVQSLTVTAHTITAGLITPDGRTYKIKIDVRTMAIEPENRTLSIDSEDRTLKIT